MCQPHPANNSAGLRSSPLGRFAAGWYHGRHSPAAGRPADPWLRTCAKSPFRWRERRRQATPTLHPIDGSRQIKGSPASLSSKSRSRCGGPCGLILLRIGTAASFFPAFHSARAAGQRALRPTPGSSGWVISLKSLLEWIAVSWAEDGAAVPEELVERLCLAGRLFLFPIAMGGVECHGRALGLDPAVAMGGAKTPGPRRLAGPRRGRPPRLRHQDASR